MAGRRGGKRRSLTDVFQALETLGAWIVFCALLALPVFGAAWIADRVIERLKPPPPDDIYAPYKESHKGYLVGGVLFLALCAVAYIALAPTLESVQRVACEGSSDLARCMDWD